MTPGGRQVLVNIQEHIDRLVAARLQADIMGAETIIVARTDGEAANLLGASACHFQDVVLVFRMRHLSPSCTHVGCKLAKGLMCRVL